MNGFWTTAIGAVAVAGLSAQAPAPAKSPSPGAQGKPTFTVQIDLITNDIVVRDEKGNFISDLNKDEFEVYEDGIRQDITSMTVVTGGRVFNKLAAPPPAAPEGIILPTKRVTNDVSGRIFVFFVDDLHLEFGSTPPCPRVVQEDLERVSTRWRHVRHCLQRPVLLVDRHDVRQDAAR